MSLTTTVSTNGDLKLLKSHYWSVTVSNHETLARYIPLDWDEDNYDPRKYRGSILMWRDQRSYAIKVCKYEDDDQAVKDLKEAFGL